MFLVFDWWVDVLWLKSHRNFTYCIDFNIVIRILNTPVSSKMAQGQRKWHAVLCSMSISMLYCFTMFIASFFSFIYSPISPVIFAMISAWSTHYAMSMIMDKSDPENPRDLNDLLRTFSDDPNNEVKTFTCSPYIDIEGLTLLLSRYKDAFVCELNNNDIQFDAICLRETWLFTDQDSALFNIPGYQLINQGKSCSSHSGLIIFLSNDYYYSIRSSHNDSKLWDGMFIEVNGVSFVKNS